MTKHSVDYTKLEESLDRAKVFRYEDVKHRLQKVAFDVVRFAPQYDDTIDGLWKIESTPDGEVIVAMYEDSPAMTTKSNWEVVADKKGSSLNIFYKNESVSKISTAKLGIPNEESQSFGNYLMEKLASDKSTREHLLETLSKEEKQDLLRKYPELNK